MSEATVRAVRQQSKTKQAMLH